LNEKSRCPHGDLDNILASNCIFIRTMPYLVSGSLARRFAHGLPNPSCDSAIAGIWTRRHWLDEVNEIHFVSDAMPYRAKSLDDLVDWRSLERPSKVVGTSMSLSKVVVHDRRPPNRFSNAGKRPR